MLYKFFQEFCELNPNFAAERLEDIIKMHWKVLDVLLKKIETQVDILKSGTISSQFNPNHIFGANSKFVIPELHAAWLRLEGILASNKIALYKNDGYMSGSYHRRLNLAHPIATIMEKLAQFSHQVIQRCVEEAIGLIKEDITFFEENKSFSVFMKDAIRIALREFKKRHAVKLTDEEIRLLKTILDDLSKINIPARSKEVDFIKAKFKMYNAGISPANSPSPSPSSEALVTHEIKDLGIHTLALSPTPNDDDLGYVSDHSGSFSRL